MPKANGSGRRGTETRSNPGMKDLGLGDIAPKLIGRRAAGKELMLGWNIETCLYEICRIKVGLWETRPLATIVSTEISPASRFSS